MSNNISLVGRIGKDAELKNVGDYKILEFSLANNTGFGDKKVTNWFRCAIWGNRGEKLASYLTKGKQAFVTGELSLRKYTNNNNEEVTSAEIKVDQLDLISSGEQGGSQGGQSQQQAPQSAETDEDLPF